MFCSECGATVDNNAKFCPECGVAIMVDSDRQLQDLESRQSEISPQKSMSMGNSISICLSKYVDFTGRASRPEYWWFYLFDMLMGWGISIVALLTVPEPLGSVIPLIFEFALFLPIIAVGTRRLHDSGRSGWNQLWILTIIGIIPVIIWLASKGDISENKYGSI